MPKTGRPVLVDESAAAGRSNDLEVPNSARDLTRNMVVRADQA